MSADISVSVVVPVYRSSETLRELHRRVAAALAPACRQFELILVDDGSSDDSWRVVRELASADPRVHGVRLSRNYGQHNALLCGIRAARYEVIVTLDDDLQNPPEEVPKLLAKLAEGFDVVYGSNDRPQQGFMRRHASSITRLVLSGAIGAQAKHVSAFRALRAYVREAFAEYASPFVSVDVLLTWGTTRFGHVSVRHDPRAAGASNYTVRKLVTHGLNMVTGFTILPLQFASLLGFSFALFGALVLAYVLIVYLIHGGGVPGFPFLASTIAIFAGVQLFALGIIGEYLARMHLRSMARPPYLVRESTARG